MNTLEVSGVTKTFARAKVLNELSFSVAAGEIVALLGPSGCGKTTMLRIIAGFETPNTGSVRINGAEVVKQRPYERDFGIVFQDYALFPHMTVKDNIAYGIRHRAYRDMPMDRRISEVLELVKLQDYGHRLPHELSGGQKQRIALARALAPNPAIMLLDEPLSALDAAIRGELRVELRRLLKSVQTTTLIVTHDQEEAMTIADRVLLMNNGNIVQEGHPLAVYDTPNSHFAAAFLGECNFLDAEVLEVKAGQCTVRLSGNNLLASDRPPNGAATGAQVEIGIRPEHIVLSPTDDAVNIKNSDKNLVGKVTQTLATGARAAVTVEIASNVVLRVAMSRAAASRYQNGQFVSVSVDPRHVLVW